ncbi:MAG TPA: class I SAM-dependent methyltransferase [Kofleriaceae bacterium]|nr:class I SAM-dependent methyltransferase [Kofleriaceae bacterium]
MEQEPDHTAVRVALWRALHVEIDPPPHVLDDELGLALAAPAPGWQQRPDMDPMRTRTMRAAIVARARFVEDLVSEARLDQYVILGAGLDTFAQRRADLASRLRVFEVDQPGTQAWKRARLIALGYEIPAWLHLVPVDFERGASWWDELVRAGFDRARPAIVSSLGVAMYLTRDAIAATLRQVAQLAPGSRFVLSFIRPPELVEPDERPGFEAAMKGAAAAGTPFLSLFAPDEIVAFARDCGFRDVQHVSRDDYVTRYFAARTDGLAPSSGEELIVART